MSNHDFIDWGETITNFDEVYDYGDNRTVLPTAIEVFARQTPTATRGESFPTNYIVKQDLISRQNFGIQKYGEPLRVNNDRNSLRDLHEELLDAAFYATQVLEQVGVEPWDCESNQETTSYEDDQREAIHLARSLREALWRSTRLMTDQSLVSGTISTEEKEQYDDDYYHEELGDE